MNIKAYSAECLEAFMLTLFGCGFAAIADKTLGTLGIALVFGLSIVPMAFVIGNVFGCHVNSAVSFSPALLMQIAGGTTAWPCRRSGCLSWHR